MEDYKSFYEGYAKKYPDDLVVRGSQLAKIKELIELKGKTGLDIGCANGAFVIELAKAGAKRMYGIDLAEEFVKKASVNARKKGAKNTEFKQADAKKLPFKDGFFDFIICTEVLEHVPDFRVAVKEIRRVLKPGGVFVVTVPNSLNPAEIVHQMKHLVFYILKKEPITHINLFFIPNAAKHFKWAKSLSVDSLHFVLPFFPKKYIKLPLIKLDLFIGRIIKLFAFDIVIRGKK